MEIHLTYQGIIIGRIYPSLASSKLGQIQGYLLPNEEFQKIRRHINKYSEIFRVSNPNDLIDRILNNLLKRKYKSLKTFYSKIGISINNGLVSNTESKIEIHDHLRRTNLGNPIIGIVAYDLEISSMVTEIECYTISQKRIELQIMMEIKKGSQIIHEF